MKGKKECGRKFKTSDNEIIALRIAGVEFKEIAKILKIPTNELLRRLLIIAEKYP